MVIWQLFSGSDTFCSLNSALNKLSTIPVFHCHKYFVLHKYCTVYKAVLEMYLHIIVLFD